MRMKAVSNIDRTYGSVHTSLSAPARLVTVGSEAAGTTYLCSSEHGEARERFSATISVHSGRKVRLDDTSNGSELLEAPLNPEEPKNADRLWPKGNAAGCSPLDWGHTDTHGCRCTSRD
jgi:hypothetical protein